jgi:hypothetical protein
MTSLMTDAMHLASELQKMDYVYPTRRKATSSRAHPAASAPYYTYTSALDVRMRVLLLR